jgi:transposase
VSKRYPEEFRRKMLDLVAAGRPVAQIGADLAISDQTIYAWRKQELIDTGQVPGLSRTEQSELSAAKKRIRELENEVAILKRSRELLREPHDPKGDTAGRGHLFETCGIPGCYRHRVTERRGA